MTLSPTSLLPTHSGRCEPELSWPSPFLPRPIPHQPWQSRDTIPAWAVSTPSWSRMLTPSRDNTSVQATSPLKRTHLPSLLPFLPSFLLPSTHRWKLKTSLTTQELGILQ